MCLIFRSGVLVVGYSELTLEWQDWFYRTGDTRERDYVCNVTAFHLRRVVVAVTTSCYALQRRILQRTYKQSAVGETYIHKKLAPLRIYYA